MLKMRTITNRNVKLTRFRDLQVRTDRSTLTTYSELNSTTPNNTHNTDDKQFSSTDVETRYHELTRS